MKKNLLHDGWALSHFDPADATLSHPPEQGWLPVNIPGTVQTSAFGLPRETLYRGTNVHSVQWMDRQMWVYRRGVEVPQTGPDETARLVFEGLDYRYEVWLNGERRIAGEGMFHPVVLGLDAWCGQRVEIEVRLLPPPREEQLETTKAQFGKGWDFTPTLRTLGIWDEVRLEIAPQLRVQSAWIETRLENRQRARVAVHAELSQEVAQGWARITLCGSQRTLPLLDARHFTAFIEVESPQLWWPNGLGEPNLHDLEITLDVPERRTEPFQQRVGLREVTRLPAPGQRAKDIPLQFAINGLPFFINGMNWVPPDAAVGEIVPAQYDVPLEAFRAGHVNLVRVWGGGLCEKAHFYNRCDELGLLVFQEYPIACGMGHTESYHRQLQSEAREIVRKLRRHPSVFLFCGGNENYHYWHMLNRSEPLLRDALQKGLDSINEGRPFDNLEWIAGAVKRYNEPVHLILGGVTTDLAPHCLYQNTSPMEDEGEVHGIWNWNPLLGDHRYRMFETNYDYWLAANQSLYSEASVSSIANLETILEVTGQGADTPIPDSEDVIWNLHHAFHGAWDKARDLWLDLPSTEKVFGPIATLRELVPLNQYLQAEGGRFMIEELRRKQPRATGVIWWGANEPWPSLAGNALIDYYGRPKASWPHIANAFAPVILSLRYDALQPDLLSSELWLSCNAPAGFSGRYTAVILDAEKGEIARVAGSCEADYLQSQPLARLLPVRMNAGQQVTVQTTLIDREDQVIHNNTYLFGDIRAAVLQAFGRSPAE